MKRVVEWFVGILCVLLIAAILFPVFAQTRSRPRRTPCLSHLKQSAVAQLMYLSDADDRFPQRDAWTDASYPYTKSWEVFHCPEAKATKWGYAFNGELDRANEKTLKAPETVPMLYDSVNPIKNASDLVASLPILPRHDGNTMGYADGHVRMLVKR
jgi:prepilin-type processing-associated H-X9-DG protein